MAVPPGRCPTCGEHLHGDTPCQPRPIFVGRTRVGASCNCLPEPRADWLTCASCGLPQAPGKSFCSFCGRRWVTRAG